MTALSLFFAASPLLLICLLLLWKKQPADTAGACGLLLCIVLAWTYFDTAPAVLAAALASALLGSLPVGFVLAASIFQITVMAEMGALTRIASCLKTLVPGHKAVQVLLINVGFGTLLTGLGAATMAILPPLLLTLGYSVPAAIVLSTLGYVALCIYALLGVPAVVLATMAGTSLGDTGTELAAFMPVISTCVAFACLHVTGGVQLMRQGAVPALLTGLGSGLLAMALAALQLTTLTAVLAGLGIMVLLLLYVKLTGGVVYDPALPETARHDPALPDPALPDTARPETALHETENKAVEVRLPLWRATSPWLLLIVFSLLMNTPSLPFFHLTFSQWAMPVEIIPGAPEKLRVFWQAYFWVLVCTLLSLPLLYSTRSKFTAACKKSLGRAWRPFVATFLYFALAYVMNHSGKNADFALISQDNNMILLLANAAAHAFGQAYAAAAPFVGLLGGFVSSSATSGVVMLTHLQMVAAQNIGASGMMLAAGSAVGAGLASAMSPAKLLSAGASIDKTAEANNVIGYTFAIALCITAVCAALTCLWAF